ncbi:hypothetical protein VQ044_15135 [Aurantimonas sp. C2-5-R2]
MIPIEPKPGLHPDTGQPVTLVGIDASSLFPRLIILISDADGTHAAAVEYMPNRPQ